MHLLQLMTIVAVHSLSPVQLIETQCTAASGLPCPSLSPGVCSNSCPLSCWCHPTIPLTVTLFSSYPQSFNIDTLLVTDVQAGFRKGREIRDQIANICWIIEKARECQKNKISTSVLLTMTKPLTVWITKNCGKFWKRWEYQTNWPASWETCMQVRKQQLELDMEQQTGSK